MAETHTTAWNQKPSKGKFLSSEKLVTLHNWYLTKVEDRDGSGKKLGVAGYYSKGQLGVELFYSAPIIERIDAFTIRTSDGFRILLDGLINGYHTCENGFPLEARSYFMTGFPFTWEACAAKYIHQDSSARSSASLPDLSQENSSGGLPLDSTNIESEENENTRRNLFTEKLVKCSSGGHNVLDVERGIAKGTPSNNSNPKSKDLGKIFYAEKSGKYIKDPSRHPLVQDTRMDLTQGSSSKSNPTKTISRLNSILEAAKLGLKEVCDGFLLKKTDNGHMEGGNSPGKKVAGEKLSTDKSGICKDNSLGDSSVQTVFDLKISGGLGGNGPGNKVAGGKFFTDKPGSCKDNSLGNSSVQTIADPKVASGLGMSKESTNKCIAMRSSTRLKDLKNIKIEKQSNRRDENNKVAYVLVGPDVVGNVKNHVEENMPEEHRDKLQGKPYKGIVKCHLNSVSSPVHTDVNRKLVFGHGMDQIEPSTPAGCNRAEQVSQEVHVSNVSRGAEQSKDKPAATTGKKYGTKKKQDPHLNDNLALGHAMDLAAGCNRATHVSQGVHASGISTGVQQSKDKPVVMTGKKPLRKKIRDPPGFQPSLTRYQMEKSSKELNLTVTRSGRLSVPPLADWCNEQLVYDMDGSITGLCSPPDMISTRTRKRKARGEKSQLHG